MIKFLIFLFFAIACAEWARLRKLARECRVVFPFRRFGSEVFAFLSDSVWKNPGALSRAERGSLDRLWRASDAAAEQYAQRKVVLFNLRKIAGYLREHTTALEAMVSLARSENPQIKEFHRRFVRLHLKALFAYAPLVRYDVILRLFVRAFRIGFSEGRRRAAEDIAKQTPKVRETWRHYGLLGREAAAAV